MTKKEKTPRQLKVQKTIQRVFMDIFSKSSFELKNKKIFVNILSVDISPDLKNTRILVDIFDADEKYKKLLIKQLNTNYLKQLRRLLSQQIQLKYVPELIFVLDASQDAAIKLDRVIEEEASNFSS